MKDSAFAALNVILNRNFRYLWMAQIFSQLSSNIMLFLLALVVYQNTSSNTAVSGLFLAYGVPAVLFGLLSGTAVDRMDRRQVLLFCDIARSILVIALYFLSHNLLFVYVLVLLNAMITQLYIPAEAPLIPKFVKGDKLLVANSLFSFTYYGSMGLGFILAGPLLRVLGTKISLVLLSGFFLAAAFCVSRLPKKIEGETRTLVSILSHNFSYLVVRVWQDLQAGFSYVRSLPDLWDSILLLTGTQVTIAILGSLGPGFADRILDIDVRDASLVIMGPAVIGIISGALWVANIGYRYQPKRLIRLGILASGLILILIPQLGWFIKNRGLVFPLIIFLFFLLGLSNSLLDVPANSILQHKATGSMRGRVYGFLAGAVGGVGMLPVVAGGLLADLVGVGKVIFFLGVIILSYGIYRMRYNRNN